MTAPSATALLVHGAFTDTCLWAPVIAALRARGVHGVAVATPLRSLSEDAAYLAAVAREVGGPVVLVGHGYGGAVATVAGAEVPGAVGLVFVAGCVPAVGESAVDLMRRDGDPSLLVPRVLRGPDRAPCLEFVLRTEAYVRLAARELGREVAIAAAAAQRPIAQRALEEPAAAASWQTLRCWSVVTTADGLLATDAQRGMASRAGSAVVEVDASFLVPASRPELVATVVAEAARS